MSTAFEHDQDQPALTAPDAGKGVSQEEKGNTAPENIPFQIQQSAFDSDSDYDYQDEDDVPTPISAKQESRTIWTEAEDGSDFDDSLLGASVESPPENADPTNESSSPRRPRGLILDNDQKRSRDDYEPEDLLSPPVSPRTRKRLRTERERGYDYPHRPLSLFCGGQANMNDPVGEIFPSIYRPNTMWDRPKHIEGRAVGRGVPGFPNLPNRPSPLGLEAHFNGKWMGVLDLPYPPMPPSPVEGERTVSPVEEEGEEWEGDLDDHDSVPPQRPSTPAPDYQDGEENHPTDSQERSNVEGGASLEAPAVSTAKSDDNRDDDASRRPSVSFEQVAAMRPKVDWADEDDDEDFLRAFTGSVSVTTGASVEEDVASTEHDVQPPEETSSRVPVIGDAEFHARDEEQNEGEGSLTFGNPEVSSEIIGPDNEHIQKSEEQQSSAPLFPLPIRNTRPGTFGFSHGTEPALPGQQSAPSTPSVLHPFHRENGREVGQFSRPGPRDEELNRLRLRNANLELQITEHKRNQHRGNDIYNNLREDYQHLRDSHRHLLHDFNTLREVHSDLEQDYNELGDELKAFKQRAEYDAKVLADAREREDEERLTLMATLMAKANSMQKWAEDVDATIEPLRQENERLGTELVECGARGLAMAALYREATRQQGQTTAAAPTPAPAAAPYSLFSPSFDSRPAPLFAVSCETPEIRQARWRNIGAHSATRDATLTARRVADEQATHNREVRMGIAATARRRFDVELAAAQRAVDMGQEVQV